MSSPLFLDTPNGAARGPQICQPVNVVRLLGLHLTVGFDLLAATEVGAKNSSISESQLRIAECEMESNQQSLVATSAVTLFGESASAPLSMQSHDVPATDETEVSSNCSFTEEDDMICDTSPSFPSSTFLGFRVQYLLVTLVVMLADGLQGKIPSCNRQFDCFFCLLTLIAAFSWHQGPTCTFCTKDMVSPLHRCIVWVLLPVPSQPPSRVR